MVRVPRRPRAVGAGVGLVAVLVALAGCVSIPTSGPIATGSPAPVNQDPPVPLAALPQRDDTPEGIVSGFFSAARAGVFDDFDVAREFLTRAAESAWDPWERLLVAASEPTLTLDGDTVVAVVELAGSVDRAGVFEEAPPGSEVTLSFGMRSAAGQWRIADLPSGIVIRDSAFYASFSPVPVYFATGDWQVAVPELRWLPKQTLTRETVQALFAGPSAWLADGVSTAAPALGAPVEVDDQGAEGVVTIALPAEAFQESWAEGQRGHLYAQLDATLLSGRLRGVVSSFDLTVAGPNGPQPFNLQPDDEVPSLETDPQPRSGPFALVDGAVAEVGGEAPEPVADLAPLTSLVAPNHPAASADGTVWVVLDRTTDLVLLTAESGEPETIHTGTDLLPPSVDRFGWVWTGERDSDGTLVAIGPDGDPVTVDAPLLADREVRSMRVSRDGARIAIASEDADGRTTIHVASIVRAGDESGEPRALGDGALAVGASVTEVTELAWSTEQTLAVLGVSASSEQQALHQVTVGGPTTLLQVVAEGTVGLAAARGSEGIYVVDADGVLRLLRGSSWVEVTTGVVDPVFPG